MNQFSKKDIDLILKIQKERKAEGGSISAGVLLVDDHDSYHYLSFDGPDVSCDYNYKYIIEEMLLPGIDEFGPKVITNYYLITSNDNAKYDKDGDTYFRKFFITHGNYKRDTIKEYDLNSFKLIKTRKLKKRTEETAELAKRLIPEHGAFTRDILKKRKLSAIMFNIK